MLDAKRLINLTVKLQLEVHPGAAISRTSPLKEDDRHDREAISPLQMGLRSHPSLPLHESFSGYKVVPRNL